MGGRYRATIPNWGEETGPGSVPWRGTQLDILSLLKKTEMKSDLAGHFYWFSELAGKASGSTVVGW